MSCSCLWDWYGGVPARGTVWQASPGEAVTGRRDGPVWDGQGCLGTPVLCAGRGQLPQNKQFLVPLLVEGEALVDA